MTMRRTPVHIRATNPYGFRPGEWAKVKKVIWGNGRPCYVVRFLDRVEDTWPVYDPADPYEFRPARVPGADE